MTPELEVFGTCASCSETSTAFPDVARRLVNGRCATCGSESVANAHTVAPTSHGQALDPLFYRGNPALRIRPRKVRRAA